MSVEVECESCGHRHKMGERVFDEETKQMICPECESRSFTVHHDITWHPSSGE